MGERCLALGQPACADGGRSTPDPAERRVQPFGAWVCHGPRPGRVLPRRRSCHSTPRAECRNFRGDAGRASGRCGHCRQAVQAAGESDCGSFGARAAANGISGARNQDAMARSWMICCASQVCAEPGTGQQKAPRTACKCCHPPAYGEALADGADPKCQLLTAPARSSARAASNRATAWPALCRCAPFDLDVSCRAV